MRFFVFLFLACAPLALRFEPLAPLCQQHDFHQLITTYPFLHGITSSTFHNPFARIMDCTRQRLFSSSSLRFLAS
jgi:hypothetical protein